MPDSSSATFSPERDADGIVWLRIDKPGTSANVLSGAVLVPTYTDRGNTVVPFAILGLALALFTVFHPGARQAKAADETSEEASAAGAR